MRIYNAILLLLAGCLMALPLLFALYLIGSVVLGGQGIVR